VVGGSEGLRRLRELIDEGYPIEARRHPSPNRDIWQYRLAVQTEVGPLRRTEEGVVYIPQKREIVTKPDGEVLATPSYKFEKRPTKVNFGDVTICPRCKAKGQRYKFKGLEEKRHKDPIKEKTPCIACNGWGIVPNIGPIATPT
jgi:hypothetical protein